MSTHLKQLLAFVLLIALIAYESARGLVPALTRIDSDFPNYLTAAKVVAERRNPDRLYEDSWFREQARGYGMEGTGASFNPFPPPTALVLVPLARLQPLTALRVMTVVNVLCLGAAVVLLASILGWSVLESTLFILLSGAAIITCLRLGQLYILISTVCLLGYYAYLKGNSLLAGVCFGLFAPIKYYPFIYPAGLALRREWKVILGTAGIIMAVILTSLAVLGWKIHATYLLSVLGHHLTARIGAQDPFATPYQSFDTMFRRLFVLDPVLNPHPLWAAPLAQVWCTLIAKAAITLVAVAALIRLARAPRETDSAPSIGILMILLMLLAPGTATYHFAMLWLPIGLLIDYFRRQGARWTAYFLLGAYAVIGFFPYQFTSPFAGRGGLTVLAYPRLFLLIAMFCVSVYSIFRRASAAQSGTSPIATVKV
jgi:Glycosyltransferase family 87